MKRKAKERKLAARIAHWEKLRNSARTSQALWLAANKKPGSL